MYNSNNNKPRRAAAILRWIVAGIVGLIWVFTESITLGVILLVCIPVLIVIVVVLRNTKRSGDPNKTNTTFNDGRPYYNPPQNPSTYNPGYNQPPPYLPTSALDAHLCDDDKHSGTDMSYAQSLNDMQGGYSGVASPTSNKTKYGSALSSHDKKTIRGELDSLLDAGIISSEEHAQRVREL